MAFLTRRPEGDEEDNQDAALVRRFGPALGGSFLFILEVLQVIVVAAAIIIPIRLFLVQPFYVRGASMEPTFADREYLLINEIGYRFHEPQRGDVVVFRYPKDPKEFFIKRIIGLPGETVDISDGRVVITNKEHPGGVVLEEPYLDQPATAGNEHVTLNPDEYFVLGDNRKASMDSRNFGPVKAEYLIGSAWLRGLPLTRFSVFSSLTYAQFESGTDE